MRKFFLFALLLCVLTSTVQAQEVYKSSGKANYSKKKKKKGYDPDKLVLGGSFDAGYNSGYAIAGVSPFVGYRVLKPVAVGVGFGYQFMQYANRSSNIVKNYYTRYHTLYPSVWARVKVFRNIYLVSAFEHDFINERINVDPSWGVKQVRNNYQANCLLGGIGLGQPMGSGRSSFFLELAHEFLQPEISPYANQPLIFRAGIMFGL